MESQAESGAFDPVNDEESIPLAPMHAASAEGVPSEIKNAVAQIGVKISENLQALSTHLGDADRLVSYLNERTQLITDIQQQVTALQRELQGIQEVVGRLPQELRQHCDGRVDSLGERLDATAQTLNEKSEQVSKLDVSVAGLIRDSSAMTTTLETTTAGLNEKDTELAARIDALDKRGRSLKWATIVIALAVVALAAFIGMQMPGG
jgi:chromosome segregation ATPase